MDDKERKIEFAGKDIPLTAATDHFCFVGSTGSGKTVLIRRLLQSVFPFEIGHGDRALVYDVKNDMLPILSVMVRDKSLVKTLNPFDTRCFAWDMAADITEPAHALEFAGILIPSEEHTSQPFFSDAARHLLAGLITAFIYRAEKKWTFRDVVFVMFNAKLLQSVLEACEDTKELSELYFKNEKTTNDIMATIATKLASFRIIAALWDYRLQTDPQAKVSLTDWIRQGCILVLGNSHTNQAALDAINRVIFKRASQLVLDQPERKGLNKTWMILDEFVRIGKLDGVVQLTTEGRSKGACIVLGFQDINGVRAIYEKEVAEEIVGQCSNIAILKLQSPETAQWASDCIGAVRIELKTPTTSFQSGGDGRAQMSMGVSVQQQDRPKTLPSEFRLLPKPTRENPVIKGYYVSDKDPFNQQFLSHPIRKVLDKGSLWEDANVDGFKPYPDGKIVQRLRKWTTDDLDPANDDYKRLDLTEVLKERRSDGLPPHRFRNDEVAKAIQEAADLKMSNAGRI